MNPEDEGKGPATPGGSHLRGELLQQAVEVLQAGIFIYTLEGKLVDVNETACRLHGWTREQMLAMSPAEFIDPSTYHVFDEFRQVVARGEEFRGLARGKRSDGTTFEAGVHGVPVTLDGRVYAFGSVRDVTEEQALREKVAQSQRMEALGRLAGSVAHDFNNLLTVIRLNTEVARASDDPQRVRTRLRSIDEATSRAESITSQLLSFSRTRPIQEELLSVREVVESLVPILERLLPDAVHLRLDLSTELSAVLGSRRALEQIVLNLVVNARDAMRDGGEVVVRAQPVPEGVSMEIVDQGIGMDPETLRRAFEPFFSTKGSEGTGLGLATVVGAVEQLRGTLDVESEPERGTRFRIELPASIAGLATEKDSRSQPPQVDRPLAGRTILVVDDDGLLRRAVCAGLERYGAVALEAAPSEAEGRLADSAIDTLICDVFMPEVSGPALVERVHRSRPDLPVLFVSGFAGAEAGDARMLAKPFSLRQLVGALLEL